MADNQGLTLQQLASLPVETLQQIKNTAMQDVETLQTSLAQLRMARDRFLESKGTLDGMKSLPAGHQVMVPLTESLYVPGKLLDPQHVFVEIGTNFLVPKDIQGADEFVARKLTLLRDQIVNVTGALAAKRRDYEGIMHAINMKQRMAQEQQ